MRREIKKMTPLTIVCVVFLAIMLVLTLYPLIFTVFVSVKTTADFATNPTGIPNAINWQNFVDAWIGANFSVLLPNTVIITITTVCLTILLASPAGFALAKLKLKGSNLMYNYLMLGLTIPFQTIMVPLMKFCRQLKMYNHLYTLILILTATSIILPVILYTSFYKSVPNEIVEAARLDGCSNFKIWRTILFPITRSTNATVAILVGMYAWREYLIPSLFATDPNYKTMVVGIYGFTGSYFNNWPVIFAAVVIQSLPLVILYLIFQKAFVEGITAGSVKG